MAKPDDFQKPAIGKIEDDAVIPGASGSVNAKLRLHSKQFDDMTTLLAGILLNTGGGISVTGIVVLETEIGDPTDPASTIGGSGSVTAKLRLITSQLDQIGYLIAASSGSVVTIPNPIGVSGTVFVNVLDGSDVTEGSVFDAAAVGDVSGSINAHLRGMDKILEDIWDQSNHSIRTDTAISLSGTTLSFTLSGALQSNQGAPGPDAWPVIVSAPVGVSGDINTHLPLPLEVSGTVNIGNVPDVNAHISLPVGVSGSVSIDNIPTVVVQGPVGVSGTVSVIGLSQPLGVSGTISSHVLDLPTPVGVSGTINIGNVPDVNAHLSLPIGVSGTVDIGNIPTVLVQGPVGVSGDLNVHLPQPLAVSGTFNTTVDIPQPLAVSGSVSVANTPLPISGNVGINGVVPVSFDQPIGVSGTFNTTVTIPEPLAVSGTVSVHVLDLPNPIGVSGTFNTNIVIPQPLGVSGTVSVTQSTSPWVVSVPDGNDAAEGSTTDAAVVGDASGSVNAHLRGIDKILADVWDDGIHVFRTVPISGGSTTVQSPLGVSGDVNAHIPLPLGVSGTVNIGTAPDLNVHLPLPVGVSGTVNIGNSPTVGVYGPIAVSGTVNVSLPLPLGVSGTVNIGNVPTVNANLPLPVGVSGTVSIGNVPDVNSHIPLPMGVSGTITVNQGLGGGSNWGVSGDINFAQSAISLVTWTSGTVADTSGVLNVSNYSSVIISFNPSGNITAGSVVFEASDDNGASYYDIQVARVDSFLVDSTFPLNNTAQLWRFTCAGLTQVRIRLNPVITGAGVAVFHLQTSAGPTDSSIVIGGNVNANLPLPMGVSGTVSIGNVPDVNAHIPLPLGVSGTVFSNVIALPLPVGVSGTVNIGNSPTIGIYGPIAISGTVNTSFSLPVGVSGTVSIGNSPTVGIYGPIAVSGTVNTSFNLPIGVSGTVSIGNSPTVGIYGPIAVSGTVSTSFNLPIGVSGSVSIVGAPVPISGNVGINGTVPVSFNRPLGVSGTVSANVIALPLPVGVSGTINIGNSPTVGIYGPIAVSGTVSTAFNLPIGVSGTVSANVIGLPLPIGVSGTVTANQGGAPWSQNVVGLPLPIGVSGTVSSNIIGFPLPVGVSGTVTANQGGAPWSQNVVGLPLPVGVSGSVSIVGTVTTDASGSAALSAAILRDVWDNANHLLRTAPISGGSNSSSNVNFALPVGVSGTVFANVIALPLPVGVSGTVVGNHIPSDIYTNPTDALNTIALESGWNDENLQWQRNRSASRVTLLASAARTATMDSNPVVSYNYRRLVVVVSVSGVVSGSINLTPRLQIQDIVTGNWITIWGGSIINSTGDKAFFFADGATGGGGSVWTGIAGVGIPGSVFRFEMVAGNANSVTYSVSAHLMP